MYLQHYKWYSLNQMPLQLFFINMYHCSSMFCICLQRNVAGRCRACSLGIINLSKNPSTLWPRAWCTTMFYRFSSVNECKYMYDQSMLVLYSILLSMLVSSVVSSLVLSHVEILDLKKKKTCLGNYNHKNPCALGFPDQRIPPCPQISKKPSLVEVWIFSQIAHLKFLFFIWQQQQWTNQARICQKKKEN